MATRTAFTRLSPSMLPRATTTATQIQSRNLSAQGMAAVQKLKGLLEEYRMKNYTQEIPTRFKKEILAEAQQEGTVDTNGMKRVIKNIHMDDKISAKDLDLVFQEIGGSKAKVAVGDLMKLI
eukprot:scaffold558_cov111-Cylindrotheca_fusiformis.AAC.16